MSMVNYSSLTRYRMNLNTLSQYYIYKITRSSITCHEDVLRVKINRFRLLSCMNSNMRHIVREP